MSDNKFTKRTSTSTSNNVREADKSKYKRDRFILGNADTIFETAEQFTGKLTAAVVTRMFANADTSIGETTGRSLKVNFTVPGTGEIKFMGFITAADGTVELDMEDVPRIKEAIETGTIAMATSIEDVVAMF
ncbi:MAG: hypothetical protein U9O94_06095 [Nanoarchaeota archaeon]|nr:hypothetical protein [Nanoarchaeota archaeon]